jgi:hypothetical protein
MTTTCLPGHAGVMRIIHNALRRDLTRAQAALGPWPYPDPSQRIAIAGHHHQAEDEGLYPIVRQRVPASIPVLDAMNADHEKIVPAMEHVTAAAKRYSTDPAARTELLDALGELATVTLPHLENEEIEMMPIAAATVSAAEWKQWDRRYNIKRLKIADLPFAALWVMDGTSQADKALCRSRVPKAFARAIETFWTRSYNRRAYRCWYRPEHLRVPLRLHGQTYVDIAAVPEAVWRVIADPRRTPEWSHECVAIELHDPAPLTVGSRFKGANRNGRYRWSRTCTVFTLDPQREFGYVTSSVPGDSTAWHFLLEPTATGTRLVQAFQGVDLPRILARIISVLIPAHIDRSAALRTDLDRLAQIIEQEQVHPPDIDDDGSELSPILGSASAMAMTLRSHTNRPTLRE